jgi:hypothetical protein
VNVASRPDEEDRCGHSSRSTTEDNVSTQAADRTGYGRPPTWQELDAHLARVSMRVAELEAAIAEHQADNARADCRCLFPEDACSGCDTAARDERLWSVLGPDL